MSYKAEIILDTLAPSGARLTTFELTYPRFIHSEFLTHREKSRNSASSRAIPVTKMIKNVTENPVIPIYWGEAKSGMQAGKETPHKEVAEIIWTQARTAMTVAASKLAGLICVDSRGQECSPEAEGAIKLNLHKQVVNRLLEPWMWMTVICSATSYDNFFSLRSHPDAQPEIKHLSDLMKSKYYEHIPVPLFEGEWHTPYIQPDEWNLDIETQKKISVARCARVSYLTHDGKRDIDKDLALYQRLIEGSGSGHWSPFEHVAKAEKDLIRSGNYVGYTQLRKTFANEYQKFVY